MWVSWLLCRGLYFFRLYRSCEFGELRVAALCFAVIATRGPFMQIFCLSKASSMLVNPACCGYVGDD
jgi:hypothetical protein